MINRRWAETVRGGVLAIRFFTAVLVSGAASAALAGTIETMPVAKQNAMVQQYCAVCHTDARANGGLSLQHFDAAHSDPGLAAMIASKLKGNALGASGQSLPDRETQDGLLAAMSAAAVGADKWFINQREDPAIKGSTLIASIVRSSPSSAAGGEPDLFRLTVACRAGDQGGEMQVAWSPGVPPQGQAMSALVDGMAEVSYRIEGKETMGNGQVGTSGPGALVLSAATPLPQRQLTVNNIFGSGSIAFPFENLPAAARESLAKCFSGR